MMNFITNKRILKLGFTNFLRNGWLSLIATLIMTLTLLIISVFLIFNLVIKNTTESVKEKIDLTAYFNDDAKDDEINILINQLKLRNDVSSVHFISKTEALEKWQSLKISQTVKEQVTEDENPLPRSLEVKAIQPENIGSIADFLAQEKYKPLVRSISYQQNKDVIDKLINITKFSQKIGIILSSIFLIISILVILNTVRLAIHIRGEEISIMRLVGANDTFVRAPFIFEALLYALFATILSLILIGLGLHYISPMITRYLGEVNLNLKDYFLQNIWVIFALELAFSAILSIICSSFSIKRYLKV